MSQQKFFKTLFEKDEDTCFSETPYGTNVSHATSWPYASANSIYFSINPMHTSRADSNVTAYRNILLEIDSLPLDQQIAYIRDKVPVTSITYSGLKSYHFIISLQEPCVDRADYGQLVRRIMHLISAADPTTKNPSRFSRLPGAIRPDTQKVQELVFLGNRIARADLEALLPALEVPKPHPKPLQGFFNPLVVDSMFYPESVMSKVGIQSRNQFFFWLGQRLIESSAPFEQRLQIVEQVYYKLQNKMDFSLREAKHAARC